MRSCLKKTPKLRPTYSALLLHPWLAPLAKPAVIEEESDDEVAVLSPAVDDGETALNGDAHGPAEDRAEGGRRCPPTSSTPRWPAGCSVRWRAAERG